MKDESSEWNLSQFHPKGWKNPRCYCVRWWANGLRQSAWQTVFLTTFLPSKATINLESGRINCARWNELGGPRRMIKKINVDPNIETGKRYQNTTDDRSALVRGHFENWSWWSGEGERHLRRSCAWPIIENREIGYFWAIWQRRSNLMSQWGHEPHSRLPDCVAELAEFNRIFFSGK